MSGQKRAFQGFGLLVLLGFAVLLYKMDLKSVIVDGHSMEPTLQPGERVITSRAFWLFGRIRHDNIVVFKDPSGAGFIIKRVFRTAGETVPLDMWPADHKIEDGPYVVPEGTVYVLGDNARQSEDSRRFGPVQLDRIIGKVVWPS